MRSTSLQATQPVKARVASHPSPYNLKGMIRLKLAFWSLIRDTYRDKNIYNDTDAWYPKHKHTHKKKQDFFAAKFRQGWDVI